jgi:hypothetical protein
MALFALQTRSACVLTSPLPRGINKHVGDCFVSARGTGVRLTSIHRVTVARIAGLDIDIEVSNTVDLGKGELVDSEVRSDRPIAR